MLDLKAGFHNVPFEEESSYLSTFVTHRSKYRWLRIPMGLTQAPAHFQYVVESVLAGGEGDRPLPVVVYQDDIAVFGDDPDQVLEDTAKAVCRLTGAGFMMNLKKTHLVQQAAKVLGHQWSTGGFWQPVMAKIEELVDVSHAEMRRANKASLYGLLNFYREYVPAFAEPTEPIRLLLGQGTRPWTTKATEAVWTVAQAIYNTFRWMNVDSEAEVRMETRVSVRFSNLNAQLY